MDTERIHALNSTLLRHSTGLWFLLIVSACGSLTGDPGSRTPGTILDDDAIEFESVQKIKASDPEFESSHIVVVSHNGVVLVAGQVATEALKHKAAEVVESMEHVASVHNELEIGPATSMAVRSNDAWLTTLVKAKLIGDSKIDADRINVTTENSVAFLMGTVTREQARYAVEVTQTVTGVEKIVKVFEYID
jgi:osmotically-inducible protein OsmY